MREKSLAQRRGVALVVSSPSGAGKTTLVRQLVEQDARAVASVSVTTREPRRSEREGVDYFFVDGERFATMEKAGDLLESAYVFGCHYGTPRSFVEEKLGTGCDVVFDIDWQGAGQLRDRLGTDVTSVFILPPSLKTLHERLRGRAEDSQETVEARMATALHELSHWREYDYVVMNDDRQVAYRSLASILEAARHARMRQVWVNGFLDGFSEGGGP